MKVSLDVLVAALYLKISKINLIKMYSRYGRATVVNRINPTVLNRINKVLYPARQRPDIGLAEHEVATPSLMSPTNSLQVGGEKERL